MDGMQAFLSFLGLLMAIYVWNTGHPIWAIVVGFLFIGGAGWMLPVWLARGVATSRTVQPKAHARLDALRIEWRARGNLLNPPVELARLYLDGFGTHWLSPSQFLDRVPTDTLSHDETSRYGHTDTAITPALLEENPMFARRATNEPSLALKVMVVSSDLPSVKHDQLADLILTERGAFIIQQGNQQHEVSVPVNIEVWTGAATLSTDGLIIDLGPKKNGSRVTEWLRHHNRPHTSNAR